MPVVTDTHPTTDTRADRVGQLVEELHAGVAALVTGAEWQRLLDVAARFHRYSFWNTVAIACQRPDATRVAGYSRWRSLGRQVRRGEQGIRILAPVTYRTRQPDDGTVNEPAPADPAAGAGESGRRVLRGFKVVSVFDVAQTDGDPLPAVRAAIIDGDTPAGLLDDLAALITAEGFTFTVGPLADAPATANGVTDFTARAVTVRAGLPVAHQAKTAAHELAHVLLHCPGNAGGKFDRARAELEAESVAYVVLGALGVTADAYSFGYLAAWSGGDPDVVRATGERVTGCARRVLDTLGALALADTTEPEGTTP